MKPLIGTKGLIILLVGLLIVGCASGPDEFDVEIERLRQNKAALDAEEYRIKRESYNWDLASKWYKQDLENWEKDMTACNQKEFNLIKRMSNEQLEIYSKYEESIKNNILANAELNLRKLNATLTDEQKKELFNIFETTIYLENNRKELIKEQIELTERKQKIVNDTVRYENNLNAHRRYTLIFEI